MVVGAHADDIEIQAGGTILKYRDRGYELIYVMSTNNMSGVVAELKPDGVSTTTTPEGCAAMMKRRKGECDIAAAALGTTPIHLDHPQRHYWGPDHRQLEVRYGSVLPEVVPGDVPSILTAYEDPPSVRRLADLILQKDPECILTHGMAQINIEHTATALLVTNAYWKALEEGYKGALLHWVEGHTPLGEMNCRWETFVDYTPFLEPKMEMIRLHRCQMPTAHLPNSPHRRRGQQWGAACGCGAAEVFTWIRRADLRINHYSIHHDLLLELINHTR
jgi:LmbE family N-acetylglucosaminyl deacetylase